MSIALEKYYLQSFSFYNFLNPKEALLVKKNIEKKEYKKGQLIFKENSYPKGIYIIQKGKVKISKETTDGRESIIYFYSKGDFFGYRPLLCNDPHPVTARTIDAVQINFLRADVFMELLNNSPTLAQKLFISLSKEFTIWINKITVFNAYSVKERVAISLLIFAKIFSKNEELKGAVISISRSDIAGFVGTTIETVVRNLRIFKDMNIITTKGTKILLENPAKLEKLISEI